MAIKQFENFDYKFAADNKRQNNQRLKVASIAFGVAIVVFAAWSFINSLNLFPTRTTNINQPISDPVRAVEANNNTEQQKKTQYENAKIPYKDPSGRFEIKFLTPYVSDQIAVIIYTPNNPEQIRTEAGQIIGNAKQSVDISNVYYINSY